MIFAGKLASRSTGAGYAAALALWSTTACAQFHEGTRELPAGGLAMAPDPHIALVSIAINVRRDEVRVAYVLKNTDASDRRAVVTFALPDIDMASIGDQDVVVPSKDLLNFVAAEVSIDDSPVELAFEQRARALGLDATAQVLTAGLPLFPLAGAMKDRVSRLEPSIRADLLERGILRTSEDKIEPAWTLKSTAHWRQTFTAGRQTSIILSYRPVVGTGAIDTEAIDELRSSFCMDKAAAKSLKRAQEASHVAQPGRKVVVSLGSGSIWHEPVPDIRIEIEKADLNAVAATCHKGMAVAGPTSLIWSASHFAPEDEISVLFIP